MQGSPSTCIVALLPKVLAPQMCAAVDYTLSQIVDASSTDKLTHGIFATVLTMSFASLA